jgi:hypothetical protein
VRIVSEARLAAVLDTLPGLPRVVAAGNHGTPWRTLRILDETVAEYRLFMLNAQAGIPDRAGVTLETPFVGAGMRGRKQLRYFPCRLSLVPSCWPPRCPRTWCWCTPRLRRMARSPWAPR